jgi:O-methyltransferase
MIDVVVFGCGDAAIRYINLIKHGNKDVNIIAFLDNNADLHGKLLFGIAYVYAPADILQLTYDLVIIASDVNEDTRLKMKEQLDAFGVDSGCITFYPEQFSVDYSPRIMFFRNFAKYISEHKIMGHIAECGVGTGETAQYLNRYFYDRILNLFDTFESYPECSIAHDRQFESFSEQRLNAARYKNTSVEEVRGKMTFPKRVLFHKGFFPDTARDVKDKFALVHMDMTLYKPTLDALRFFWCKMSPNGIILVRDYFAEALPGPRNAITDFEAELKKFIVKTPIGDSTCIALIR